MNLAASVAAMAELASIVFTNLKKYYDDVKNLPSCTEDLRRELESMHGLALKLQYNIEHGSNWIGIQQWMSLESAINSFHAMLRDLEGRLELSRVTGFRRLTWSFNEETIKKLLERIERFKATFILALELMKR